MLSVMMHMTLSNDSYKNVIRLMSFNSTMTEVKIFSKVNVSHSKQP